MDAAIAPRGGGGRDNVAFLQHHANATAEWKARCRESGMGVATTREIIASSLTSPLALPQEEERGDRIDRIGGDDEQTA